MMTFLVFMITPDSPQIIQCHVSELRPFKPNKLGLKSTARPTGVFTQNPHGKRIRTINFLCNCYRCNFQSISTKMKSGATLFSSSLMSRETSCPDPAIPLPGISPREMKTRTETYTQTFRAAPFVTVRKWERRQRPSVGDGWAVTRP